MVVWEVEVVAEWVLDICMVLTDVPWSLPEYGVVVEELNRLLLKVLVARNQNQCCSWGVHTSTLAQHLQPEQNYPCGF